MDRGMIDAANGGALVDKTPTAAKSLIENMASNSPQFASRNNLVITRAVNEVDIAYAADHSKLETKIDELASMVKQLAMIQKSASTVPVSTQLYGICSSIDHYTDVCPTLQETDVAGGVPQAYVANIYISRPQQQQNFDPNRYYPSWRNHPNFRWGSDAATSSNHSHPLYQTNASPSRPYQPSQVQ